MLRVLSYSLIPLLLVLQGPAHGGPGADPGAGPSAQELLWGSDQYDFAIVVQASALDCFWHHVHQGEKFYLTYMVQWVTGVADRRLSVSVNSPAGLPLSTIDETKGQVSFLARETGFYQMCFNNFHNRLGSMQVFLSFGVYYEGAGEEEEAEEKQKELNDTLAIIEVATIMFIINLNYNVDKSCFYRLAVSYPWDSSHRLQAYVFHMGRYYSFARMSKGADYYLLLSNASYVTWWSAAQSAVIITAGYLQLLVLKRLFQTTTSTERNKPRC